jgi:16S rRNA (cytosine967-C5)-methyltransferase
VVAGGELAVTDPASTAVVLALSPQPGERILDLAAAPGGKTMHLVDLAGAGSAVVALDRHRRRLDSARRRLAAAGVSPLWVCGDGRTAPLQTGSFDAVLVDAPCTGLGTLRRRPEIAMRLEAGAPARLASVQRAMLAEAWRLTRPGGRIVYSVCTVFAEETTRIVDEYPAARPRGLPGRPWGRGLLLAPHVTGTDGMFISDISRSE